MSIICTIIAVLTPLPYPTLPPLYRDAKRVIKQLKTGFSTDLSPIWHPPKTGVPKQGSGEEISGFLVKIALFFRLLGHPKKLGGGQNLVYLSSRNLWNLRYPLLSPWFWTIFSWGPPHGFGIPPGKWPLFFRLLAQSILGSENPILAPKSGFLSPFWGLWIGSKIGAFRAL